MTTQPSRAERIEAAAVALYTRWYADQPSGFAEYAEWDDLRHALALPPDAPAVRVDDAAVEAAARALYGHSTPWDASTEARRESFRDLARACLRAAAETKE